MIPPDGLLQTCSPEQYGLANDDYYSYSTAGSRPLPHSGPGILIWSKINGEASSSSGTRKYEEFFVGTEQQFIKSGRRSKQMIHPRNGSRPKRKRWHQVGAVVPSLS
jgi:hypothetical protein